MTTSVRGVRRADRHGLPADATYAGDVDDRFDADPARALASAPHALLLGWYALHHLVALFRYLLIRAYRRARPPVAAAPLWARRFVIGTSAAGLIWATVGSVLFPTDGHPMQFFIGMYLVGVAATGMFYPGCLFPVIRATGRPDPGADGPVAAGFRRPRPATDRCHHLSIRVHRLSRTPAASSG
jgi:hypothetical protein